MFTSILIRSHCYFEMVWQIWSSKIPMRTQWRCSQGMLQEQSSGSAPTSSSLVWSGSKNVSALMRVTHMAVSKCSESLHPFIQCTQLPGNIYDEWSYWVLKLGFKALALDSVSSLQKSTPTEPWQGLVAVRCNRSMQSIHTDMETLPDQYQIQFCTNEIDLSSLTVSIFFFHFVINLPDSLPEELIRMLAFEGPLYKLCVVYLFQFCTYF